ncbi:MAG: LysR family transcriptional regulator, partial [Spirochaetia bacterium]|nr:LysR family transcriptional regulator [Spirochaetia bacterium]
MELRVLRYFLAVAREENITKAAELLHITQPTLSRQLSELEDELGATLFERKSHRIRLTQDGLLLQRSAKEIVELADKTKAQFAQEEIISGTISFGCGELMSMSKLASIMADFKRQYPLVHFDIESGNADHIKYQLEKGLLD